MFYILLRENHFLFILFLCVTHHLHRLAKHLTTPSKKKSSKTIDYQKDLDQNGCIGVEGACYVPIHRAEPGEQKQDH